MQLYICLLSSFLWSYIHPMFNITAITFSIFSISGFSPTLWWVFSFYLITILLMILLRLALCPGHFRFNFLPVLVIYSSIFASPGHHPIAHPPRQSGVKAAMGHVCALSGEL